MTEPRRDGLRVWLNGTLVPAEQASVSVYERGFRTGEGVFETLRAYGDHVFRLETHLERARAGARELAFDLGPTAHLAEAVRTTARANLEVFDGADSAIRLTTSAGTIDPYSPVPGHDLGRPPSVVVTSHPLSEPRPSASAVSVPLARELPHVKAVSYLVAVTARRQAAARGADEALLTDGAGHLLEGASSNVLAVLDGRLVTPAADDGLLAGVTRGVVLELAARLGLPVEERAMRVEELHDADEAMLTSTTREIVPLREIDGHVQDGPLPGPWTGRLQRAYRDEVQRERRGREPSPTGPVA